MRRPPGAPAARTMMLARGVRAFVDGIAFVALPAFLDGLGFSGLQIGTVLAASLVGSAVFTLAAGSLTRRHDEIVLLRAASWVMLTTGIAFGLSSSFVALLVISFVTTMNPNAGDVSAFLPLEQSVIARSVADRDRTAVFGRYNLIGSLVGAVGALCAGAPTGLARLLGAGDQAGRRGAFVLYGITGLVLFLAYSRGRSRQHPRTVSPATREGLSPASRRVVTRLALLFSLDAFGGGFAGQSIFALWAWRRFGISFETMGAVYFAVGIVSAWSSLLAVRIAARIGLVRTMVFTHIPASLILAGVAFAPNAAVAMTLFVVRGLVSQMDVPVRTSYVMAVVEPHERAAAASLTNVPRSLAAALPPVAAGWMLDASGFGWPLLACAACKIAYDLLLLAKFAGLRPPEETRSA